MRVFFRTVRTDQNTILGIRKKREIVNYCVVAVLDRLSEPHFRFYRPDGLCSMLR
jgi:hypothetical protein